MKKLLYILAFVLTCSACFTACTEDEIRPTTGPAQGGGASNPLEPTN